MGETISLHIAIHSLVFLNRVLTPSFCYLLSYGNQLFSFRGVVPSRVGEIPESINDRNRQREYLNPETCLVHLQALSPEIGPFLFGHWFGFDLNLSSTLYQKQTYHISHRSIPSESISPFRHNHIYGCRHETSQLHVENYILLSHN